jgi:hypothetical protein
VVNGCDLLAFDVLIATFNDWLAICQNNVPAVPKFGVNIPAVTTRFDKTHDDILNGKNTVSPVSGCNVESKIFLARHNSGVILDVTPFL